MDDDNFELPKEWWVNAKNKEENKILTDWCNKNLTRPEDKMNDYFSNISNNYSSSFKYNTQKGEQITFAQFEKYVLDIPKEVIIEDYTYLNKLFEKLNII